MAGIVYYSLSLQNQPKDVFRLSQLLFSLRSLRRHNPTIPVLLNLNGSYDKLFLHFLTTELGVIPVVSGSYVAMLDAVLPGSGRYLENYPILHKFLFLLQLRELKPEQLLYVDTDTLFFDDPAKLFAQCREHDLYGRLELFTSPADLDARPGYFLPEVYTQLAQTLASRVITPFNTGVMVLNNQIWERFAAESQNFLEYVLRLSPAEEVGTVPDFPPLPYPGSNRWIRDQVAFWLVLGRLEHFSFGQLDHSQLLMGAEEVYYPQVFRQPIISHYFSENTEMYFKGLAEEPFRQAVDRGPKK